MIAVFGSERSLFFVFLSSGVVEGGHPFIVLWLFFSFF